MRLLGLVAILAIGALAQDDFDEFGGVRMEQNLTLALRFRQKVGLLGVNYDLRLDCENALCKIYAPISIKI